MFCKYSPTNLQYFKEVYSTEQNKVSELDHSFFGEYPITLEGLVSEQTIGFRSLPLIINFGSVVSKPMLLEFATRLSNDTRQKFIKIIPFGPESVIYLRNNGFETLYDVIHSIELQEKTTAELKRGLRKSYKSLVTKQEGVLVVEDCFYENIMRCRELHYQVSGRRTRSLNSWQIMAKSLEKGEALLVIKEDGCKLVGYNYFMLDGHSALYASAAIVKGYNGHSIMWASITRLKAIGVKSLLLDSSLDKEEISDKEKNISDYKNGFSNKCETEIIFFQK